MQHISPGVYINSNNYTISNSVPVEDYQDNLWLNRNYRLLLSQQQFQIPTNEFFTYQQCEMSIKKNTDTVEFINLPLDKQIVNGEVFATSFNYYSGTEPNKIGASTTYTTQQLSAAPTKPEWVGGTGFIGKVKGNINLQLINKIAPTVAIENLSVIGTVLSDDYYNVGISATGWQDFITQNGTPSFGAKIPVNPDGTWEVYFTGYGGIVSFAIVNTNTDEIIARFTSGQEHKHLEDCVVQLSVYTDSEYFLTEGKLLYPCQSITFNQNNTSPNKIARLVEKTTNKTLAYTSVSTGLPRSFNFSFGTEGYTQFLNRAYTYDAAVSLLAMVALTKQDDAKTIADALILTQYVNGAFPFACNAMSKESEPYFRTGAIAWVVYSLSVYCNTYEPESPTLLAAISSGLTYILSKIKGGNDLQTGLVGGGSGKYSPAPTWTFDANYQIPWVSTEHNIDVYACFNEVKKININASLKSACVAANILIKSKIDSVLWDESTGHLRQGIVDGQNLDVASSLDCHSWGVYHFVDTNQMTKSTRSLTRMEQLYKTTITGTTGYTPYIELDGYSGATPTIWPEGTYGAAIAYRKIGNSIKWRSIIQEMNELRTIDFMLPYANIKDVNYEITDQPGIIGVAWDVLARISYETLFSSQ